VGSQLQQRDARGSALLAICLRVTNGNKTVFNNHIGDVQTPDGRVIAASSVVVVDDDGQTKLRLTEKMYEYFSLFIIIHWHMRP
jgi:hypothetical protein